MGSYRYEIYKKIERSVLTLQHPDMKKKAEGLNLCYQVIVQEVNHPWRKKLAEMLASNITSYLEKVNTALKPFEFYALHFMWSYLREQNLIKWEYDEKYLEKLLDLQKRFLEESISKVIGDGLYFDETLQAIINKRTYVEKELNLLKSLFSYFNSKKVVDLFTYKYFIFKKKELHEEKKKYNKYLEELKTNYIDLLRNFILISLIEEALFNNYIEFEYYKKVKEKYDLLKHTSVSHLREVIFRWLLLYYDTDSSHFFENMFN